MKLVTKTGFTYVSPPVVSAISPLAGQNGTVLTITGTGFGASVTPGLGANYGQV